jgi:hypothetical protein
VIYLDSSFLLSYLFKESNYDFSKSVLESDVSLWSSDLLRFEAMVSFWKQFPKGDAERFQILESLWKMISFVKVGDSILEVLIQNPKVSRLRTLDSIHIASYLFIAKESKSEVLKLASFDERMLAVAKSLKIPVISNQSIVSIRKPKKKK